MTCANPAHHSMQYSTMKGGWVCPDCEHAENIRVRALRLRAAEHKALESAKALWFDLYQGCLPFEQCPSLEAFGTDVEDLIAAEKED